MNLKSKIQPIVLIICFGFLTHSVLAQTTPAGEQPLTPRTPNYVLDLARPADKINASYPYDIPIRTISGDTVTSDVVLPSLGKPILLLFWLTTCYPCRMELETILKAWPQWKESLNFEMVAISTDFPKNYPAVAQRVTEQNWPWHSFIDLNREFGRILPGGLNGLPQTFILNDKGEIVYHKRKFRPGDEVEIYNMLQSVAMKK